MEASAVFGDALAATIPRLQHPKLELRFLMIGMSSENRLLVASHADLEESVRIISARTATAQEKKAL